MARIVDVGIKNGDTEFIIRTGIIMIIMALLALGLGVLHGCFAVVASVGFAKGIRKLFDKIRFLQILISLQHLHLLQD